MVESQEGFGTMKRLKEEDKDTAGEKGEEEKQEGREEALQS